MRRLTAAPLAVFALVLSGCSTEGGGDALQVVADPVAATAAPSPEPAAEPAGRVVPHEAGVSALATDPGSRTLAVAQADPPAVLLYDLDDLGAPPTRVRLPAQAASLHVADGTLLAALPDADELARISLPDGSMEPVTVDGAPAGAVVRDGSTLVALRDRKGVAVLEDDRVTRTIAGGLYSADDVLVAGGETVVLDRHRTALFEVNLSDGTIGEGLRAGQGATNAVTDSFGRVLVVDSRASALLAFSTDPLLLRQRYPVPGGAYDVAYDSARHIAWVTLTRRNEVVGFDVRGGQPQEKYRYATVRQPNSVTVDERTSRVVVGSAAGEGIQVITL